MNKNKLIIMGLTFLVLIALTPLIFGKLMNKQYNKMLDRLRSEGFTVTVVKDSSTYLQNDKVLEVKIPAKLLNTENYLKEINLKIETRFKNLPVTNVYFIGKIENIKLTDKYAKIEKNINDFLVKYIKFTATTPNFRDYSYKFEDIIVKKSPEIGIVNIEGNLKYSDIIKNSLTIGDIYIKDKKEIVEFKNFKNEFEGNEKNSLSKIGFDVHVDINKVKIQINNVYSVTKTILSKTAYINSVFGFKKLIVANMAQSDDFALRGEINNIDTNLTQTLATAKSDDEKNMIVEKIFEKGFDVKLSSSLKNLKAMGRDFGWYDLNVDVKFLPTKNLRQKVQEDKVDFVDAKINFTTTPEMSGIIMNLVPQSSFVFALAKKENGKVTLNLEFKKGKLYSDGQLIK